MNKTTQPDSWLSKLWEEYGLENWQYKQEVSDLIKQHQAQAVELAELQGQIKESTMWLEDSKTLLGGLRRTGITSTYTFKTIKQVSSDLENRVKILKKQYDIALQAKREEL